MNYFVKQHRQGYGDMRSYMLIKEATALILLGFVYK